MLTMNLGPGFGVNAMMNNDMLTIIMTGEVVLGWIELHCRKIECLTKPRQTENKNMIPIRHRTLIEMK